MSDTVKLESGDSYLVTDSSFVNQIYLIIGERRGARSPKGNAALAQLNKSETAKLIAELQAAHDGMT